MGGVWVSFTIKQRHSKVDVRLPVFVETKKSTARLGNELQTHGFRVAVIHGDCLQAEREKALRRYDITLPQAIVTLQVRDESVRMITVIIQTASL